MKIEEETVVEAAEPEVTEPEVTVSIGDEEPKEEEQPAPAWVKEVRKRNRELERELRDTRKKLNEMAVPKEDVLGDKPTLEKVDYDAAKYETELSAWYERKRKIDEKAAAADAKVKTEEQKWLGRLDTYKAAKTELGVSDFDEAEAVVLDLLDQVQQGIIVSGAKDAAVVVYALGKNEEKARALAAIKDPVEFAFAVARLEAQMKVSNKKPATVPEERVIGSGRPSGALDATLERLRAEAEKTGDYTKVLAHKRQHQKA